MTTLELLQKSIDYIEANLKCELLIPEIAAVSGFSTYHFCHLFSDLVGLPVAAYITKRRIYHAIYAIQTYGEMTQTAYLYGFDTHAGFYKAFKRHFGCSPSKYLKLNTATLPSAVNLLEEAKIMLTNTQIRQFLTHWDIPTSLPISPTYCAGGATEAKNTWSIGEDFIFKTGKDLAGIRVHLAISKALASEGMITAYPILTKEGSELLIEGDTFYCLTHKVSGAFLSPEERYQANRQVIGSKYGEALGKLHQILKQQYTTLEVNDTNLLDTVLNWAMPETKRVMEQWGCPLPDAFYEDYINNFPTLYPYLPRQVIHRDANPSNIMFQDGEVSGFIDFVISERNVRLFDPCYCATGILSEASNIADGFKKWPDLLKGILSGYDQLCPLSFEEKQAVPYIIYSIQMIFIAWLVEHEVYKDCALQNRKMLCWIWENRESLFN